MSRFRHQPVAPTTLRRLTGGATVDRHRHDDHQIAYASAGVLSVTTDRGSWIAPGSRAIWIPAGTLHEHRAYGDTDLRLIGLPVSDNPLGLTEPALVAVDPLLRELIVAYTEDPADGGDERARLRAVLLDRLRPSPEPALRLPSAEDPRLAAVCAALDADPADTRDLATLGATAGASARTLSRLFRREFAMTFPQWRTQLRLHHALILLAEDLPVTVVAHRVGWASTSAFIDVYRRAFNHTPGRRP